TNIFYFGNRIHDVAYRYGFTEKFGNMQSENFDRGGRGHDAVRFMAMAGVLNGQFDNAFMFTPADGGEPQDLIDTAEPARTIGRATSFIPPFSGMFLWKPVPTFQAPCVDGDFDASTAYHEYAHGISNRMTGGGDDADALSAHQSGSMGEAWSDWIAHMILEQEGLEDRTADGIYITGNTITGIRHFALDKNPLTYGDIGFGRFGPEVHDDGEIWSGTLWDLKVALVAKQGKARGIDKAMRLVFDGMAMQTRLPDMLDGRDAILKANQVRYKGADAALIWDVFARRGMGRSARSIDANDVNPRPGFDSVTPNGYLAGTIRDIGGSGMIAKVLVGLGEGKPTPVAVTPRSGQFRIPMTPGRYTVTYAAAGYGLQKIGTVVVSAGRTTTIRPIALNRNLASAGWGALIAGGLAAGDPGTALLDDHEFTGQIVEVGKPVTIMLGGTGPATVRGIAVSTKPAGGGTSQNATGYKVETSIDGRSWRTALTGGVKRYKPRPIAMHWTRTTKGMNVQARYVRVTVTSALANTRAILSGIQVLGSAPGMAVAPVGGGKPFVDSDGSVAVANAAGPDASITYNEFSLGCMTPLSQGLDAYVVALPRGAGDGVHNFATKGGQELARDLDAYFYGPDCSMTGAIASPSADEAGPIPPGSAWAVIVLFAGTTDGFKVEVTSTLERVIPPPGTPTRTPRLPAAGNRTAEQSYIATGGDLLSTACFGDPLPEPYVGGGCFEVRSGERTVKVTVHDDEFANPSGFWAFRDADGNMIGDVETPFCGSFTVSVPRGAAELSIWLDQAFAFSSDCEGDPATTGTIKAVFSS
ncbi:MAG TPA: M36 family metallopeptidase, partial [Actinomycetota bacterium]|nr:M36 family metallopeptidase [Actinomycetota bacterium]